MLKRSVFFLLIILLLAGCSESEPTPTTAPTAVAKVEPAATETAVPPTATTEPTEEATAEPTVEPTLEPTATPDLPFPLADIANDEGGPVSITGVVTYTNPFFTWGVAAPVVILEDQAGFVTRNEEFIMPVESQALGQITSDFYTSPFSYSLALPIEPQGTLQDVDNDGETDTGIQVFAIAYWTNTFGDPFLEERDLHGGGWSTAYASTEVSDDADTEREIVGGKFLIYAPDEMQGFPTGFGDDGLLFTEDDPIVLLPQGYTIVDMDNDPFIFDRSSHPVIDLIEPEGAALVDYSEMDYAEAFAELVAQLQNEYAFTEYKGVDWEGLQAEFQPLFEEAAAEDDAELYRQALRDFAWSIPDGHVSGPWLQEDFAFNVAGGLGIAVRELEDGRAVVNYLLEDTPAADAGMELGAEILAINDVPISEAIEQVVPYTGPFSTDHVRRLQQQVFVTRFPVETDVSITFQNPGSGQQTADLTTEFEVDSFYFSLQDVIPTGFELPLEYALLDSGYGYAQIYSFSDNELLTIQLWERLMQSLNDNEVPGLIIDMRQNGGGSGFLADQMAAYFFDDELTLGNAGFYDEDRGEFYMDPRYEDEFILPAEDLRYEGEIVVIVGPQCASACEFFSYDMTLEDRAVVVGHFPTAGLGGSIDRVLMPEDEFFTFTQGRAVNADGEIHIEGLGIPPTVFVPITEEILFGEGDVLLETAVAELDAILR